MYSKEKFSDIVEWLKAKAVEGESSPPTGSLKSEKKTETEHKKTDVKLFQGQTSFAPASATTSIATSWTSGALFNHQAPSIFGNITLLALSIILLKILVSLLCVPCAEFCVT